MQAKYEQVQPVKYVKMGGSSGYPEAEQADYPEMTEQNAVNLFGMVAVIAGVVPSPEDFPDGSITVTKGFSPAEYCNIYRVAGSGFETDVRTKDCLVILAARFGAEDPAELLRIVPLGEAEARTEAEYLFGAISEAQRICLDQSSNLPSKPPVDYRLKSFSRSGQTGADSWSASWERVSAAGIPYHGEGAALMLRADGLLKNLTVHQANECIDTEPVVSEEEAVAIARPIFERCLAEIEASYSGLPGGIPQPLQDISIPDTAELCYVVPYRRSSSDAAPQPGLTPSYPQQTCLAWVIEAGLLGEVRIDAVTGEDIGTSLMHY